MTLKLHELPGDPGKTQHKKRVGRGEGSGRGRTAGKGNKGLRARSGGVKGPGFEGGQMPLARRMPKFGFDNSRFQLRKTEVTLAQLENKFESGASVDVDALRGVRLVPKQIEYVKVVATGQITKPLNIKLHGYSAKARQAVEAAGGTCEVVTP